MVRSLALLSMLGLCCVPGCGRSALDGEAGGQAGSGGASDGAGGGLAAGGGTAGIGGTPATGGTGGVTGGAGGSIGGTAGTGGFLGCGVEGPSCAAGLTCNGESCCTNLPVPGGTYDRGSNPSYPATVSDFCLDKYEITVGRFRQFVNAYDAWRALGNPQASAGEHVPGYGSGWQIGWSSSLPANAAAFTDASHLACDATYQTWRDTAGTTAAENVPINCIDWYEAFAFCIWDGGRLATEAEWEYAAGHGGENRRYPWGATAPTISLAIFNCEYGGTPRSCAFDDIAPVGSVPNGNGFWGQADQAGSMWEWAFDWSVYPFSPPTCNNCANTTIASKRVVRGGSFDDDATSLTAANRSDYTPTGRRSYIGARCVRSAP